MMIFFFFFWFACSMARGQEETSTSQAGRKKGTPRESPTTSSMVVVMSAEELRSFFQILADISLELSDGVAVSIVGGENNAAYFTQEQFAVRLLPHLVVSEAVLTFHSGISYAHTSGLLSDFDGL